MPTHVGDSTSQRGPHREGRACCGTEYPHRADGAEERTRAEQRPNMEEEEEDGAVLFQGPKKGPTLRPQLRFGNPHNACTGEANAALLAEATANSKAHVRFAKDAERDARKEAEAAEKEQLAAEADMRATTVGADKEDAETRALDASALHELARSKLQDSQKIAELVVSSAEAAAERAEKRLVRAAKAAHDALATARADANSWVTMWTEVEQPPAELMRAATKVTKMARERRASKETRESDAVPASDAASSDALYPSQKQKFEYDRIDTAARRIADAEKMIEDAQWVESAVNDIAKAQLVSEKAAAAKAAAIRKARAEEALRHARKEAAEAIQAEREALTRQRQAEESAAKAAEEARNSPEAKAVAAAEAEAEARAAEEAAEIARSLAGAARARQKEAEAAMNAEKKDELRRAREDAAASEAAQARKIEEEKAEEARLAARLEAQAKRVAEAKARAAAEAVDASASPARMEEAKAEAKDSMVVATAVALAAQAQTDKVQKEGSIVATTEMAPATKHALISVAHAQQATIAQAFVETEAVPSLPSQKFGRVHVEAMDGMDRTGESRNMLNAESPRTDGEAPLHASRVYDDIDIAEQGSSRIPSGEQTKTIDIASKPTDTGGSHTAASSTVPSALNAVGKALIESAKPREGVMKHEGRPSEMKREVVPTSEEDFTEPSEMPWWIKAWQGGAQRSAEMTCALSVTSDCLIIDKATSNTLVCIGGDGDSHTVSLYSLQQHKVIQSLQGHSDKVVSVACDGGVIASGSKDQTIRLWSASTGECTATLSGCAGTVHGLSLKGGLLLSGEGGFFKDGGVRVRLWSIDRRELVAVFEEHRAVVWSVVLGNEVGASASHDKTAKVWSINGDSNAMATFQHPAWVCSVSMDRDLVATGCADTRVRLWSLSSKRCVRAFMHGTVASGSSPAFVVRLVEGGGLLLSGGQDQNIKLWAIPHTKIPDSGAEPGVGEPVCLATAAHGEMVRGLAMNPSDRFFVSAGGRSSSGLVIWRPHDEATEEQINEETKVGREDIRGAARHPNKEKEKEKEQRPARKGRRTSSSPASTARPSKNATKDGNAHDKRKASPIRRSFLG